MRHATTTGGGARRGRPVRCGSGLLCALALLLVPASAGRADQATGEERSRLSPVDFKVITADRPLTGAWSFRHPVSGEPSLVEIRAEPAGAGLSGILAGEDRLILVLTPKKEGVGWEGELRGILTACGQDRVRILDLLPLGEKLIVRLDAAPTETPCLFLESRETARLLVAPTSSPIPLRSSRDIVSERTKEQIGLAGLPNEEASPIVAGDVSVEGGTELKFVGRTRSLDGTMWVQVEALVSPAPGIEPPRGFMRASELRVDASLELVKADAAKADP